MSSSQNPINPSEVGWQFVPQYYTFVNQEPNRLHCFYNKNSTFIHGTEGEDTQSFYGQQEIHKKITSIDFQNCRVFIHSVDAQSSANGGIIIQVIGQMSNKDENWRKFVQTFFLAEQPNGYFVLNDIFRFLKEEAVDEETDDADESEPYEVPAQPATAPAASAAEPSFEAPREPTPPPAPAAAPEPVAAAPAVVDEAPTNDVAEPSVTQASSPSPQQAEPKQLEEETQPLVEPTPAPVKTNGIHAVEPEKAPAAAEVPEPAAAPAPIPAPAPVQHPAPTQPAAPSAPRTWATLAAANPKKWGPAVAQESRGTTETVSVPSSGAATPVTTTPAPQTQRPQQPKSEHPAYTAAQSITTPQVFIKGVVEPIAQPALTNTLTTRFGPVKDLEIVRSKACAFVEFQGLESAKRAILASLPTNQGGDGGVWIEVPGGESLRINIETKKERPERTVSTRRGGAPTTGEAPRGGHPQQGYRGRGGGRGRGAPPAAK